MKTIYLNEHRDASLIGRLTREWNSGSSLSEAVRYLETRHGFDRTDIIPLWRTLRKQWGCRSISFRPKTIEQIIAKSSPEYLAWKGITGPGAVLRAIVQEQRS